MGKLWSDSQGVTQRIRRIVSLFASIALFLYVPVTLYYIELSGKDCGEEESPREDKDQVQT